jgi:hypothetical protein
MTPPVTYVFKLRRNIRLEGDVQLARMELEAFMGQVQAVSSLEELLRDQPLLAQVNGWNRPGDFLRDEGVQFFRGEGDLHVLPDLIRRVSFVQEMYGITPDTAEARDRIAICAALTGPVLRSQQIEGSLLLRAIPHYCLLELSEGILRQCDAGAVVFIQLEGLRSALLGETEDRAVQMKAERALSSRITTTSHLFHDLHFYKAKFFPRLARSLLNINTRRSRRADDTLLDPFVGSGTSLLEAALLGIPSVGVDLDPLSCLIARTKVEALKLDHGCVRSEVVRALQALEIENECNNPDDEATGALPLPDWLMKNRRMTPEIAAELGEIVKRISAVIEQAKPEIQDLFRVLLSDALCRKMRFRFLGTGVGRFSFTYGRTPLVRLFTQSLRRIEKTSAAWTWLKSTLKISPAPAQVVQGDARCLPEAFPAFGLILTSPPYLPASSGRESYALARAPSLLALGLANSEEVENLIGDSVGSMEGAFPDLSSLTPAEKSLVEWLSHDLLRSVKAGPTARYFVEMRQAFAEMRRILNPGGQVVLVSGKQSAFYKYSTRELLHTAPVAEMLAEEAERAGLEVVALHDLQLQKANRNARPRSLDDYYETLIMLRKPGE